MFMAFGAGGNPCVGKRFALLEIALLTAQVIQQLDMILLEKDNDTIPSANMNKEWSDLAKRDP